MGYLYLFLPSYTLFATHLESVFNWLAVGFQCTRTLIAFTSDPVAVGQPSGSLPLYCFSLQLLFVTACG